jgi:diguanylate cyclase (GGDEF)-like protein
VTDLSLYDRDDTEHVGWFWQPYDAGEAVWMAPYYNRNNGILMISYVVPMYCEGRFIGVVGMDFDYHILMDRVHSIRVYENGFAHLEMNGVVIHAEGHGDAEDVTEHPEKYLQESKELVNGMTLVVSASLKDIRQIDREIVRNILLAVLLLSALFALVAFFAVKRIVEPLKKLTAASEKLSNGEYNVEHVHSNTREIRLLSVAFEQMAVRLREREGILHRSAYRDTLTGLRNTTSCKAWVEEFEKTIRNHQADFGVVVLDINELKNANDLHGHDVGNELIVSSAKIISNVFKHSPVFRIGGDEFLVVLQNSDLANREILFEQFDRNCAQSLVNETARISVRIALGFARFEAGKDQCFADVFKRADEAMYRNKRMSKMGRD